MSENRRLDRLLDEAVEGLRSQEMDPRQAAEAADRVRQRLATQIPGFSTGESGAEGRVIRGCGDFQAMIPAFLEGTLAPSRALLLEDHQRSCLPCRRALQQARTRSLSADAETASSGASAGGTLLRWAAAAVLVVGLGATAWTLLDTLPLPTARSAEIAALEGELYRLTGEGFAPLAAGQSLPFGETVRSAKDSGAVVRLEDGTEIELGARSELELVRRRRGTTIELASGSIIVAAAPQGAGSLFVSTDDCLVSVKGTIFSVNRGTKGSRVSVVEGRVVVDHGSQRAVLDSGGQVSTHPSLRPVPVSQEIAWSRRFDEYLELMRELGALGRELDETLSSPAARYSTRLLDRMPPGTTFYAAVPNLSGSLEEALAQIQERVAASPALERWWQESLGSAEEEAILARAIAAAAELGGFLGEEITLSLATGGQHAEETLLLLSETVDAAGLRRAVQAHLLAGVGTPRIRIVEDPRSHAAPPDGGEALLLWIRDDLVALAPRLAPLQQLAAVLQDPQGNPFLRRPFHQRLAQVYADGADWLIGADMGRILAGSGGAHPEVLEQAGILDVSTLVLERKQGTGSQVHYRAALSFDGPRRGVAAWLAPPAPMGSLDFVSPDANFVSSMVSKDPRQVIEELLALVETASPDLRRRIADLETEHGLALVEDIAAPLAGEITFAFDGPILPTPSWKLVAEVYDFAHLQETIRRLVDLANRQLSGPERLLELVESRHGGTTFYALRSPHAAAGIHYTFVDGYLLMGPSQALLEHAIEYRDSGYSLTRSDRFAALLPPDGQANFSAMSFQNLEGLLAPLAELWAGRGGELTPGQREELRELVAQTPATLTCVYGEHDRIVAVSNSERGELSGLLGLSTALGLEEWMEKLRIETSATPEEAEPPPAPESV